MKIGYRIQIDGTVSCHEFELQNGAVTKQYRNRQEDARIEITMSVDKNHMECGKLSLTAVNHDNREHRIGSISYIINVPGIRTLDYFTSDWGNEFNPVQSTPGAFKGMEVLSGRSSKGFSPWIGCSKAGSYFSAAIAWSGNWSISLSGNGWLMPGLDEKYFEKTLKAGESMELFELYFSDSDTREHSASAMRNYFFEKDSLLKKAGWSSLPVTYNTWWCFEDKLLSEAACLANAKLCGEAGVDNFMLDAGWFGGNRKDISWFEKRGDWEDLNTLDFPGGMVLLGSRILGLGVRFGIWCEIEAVGECAELHRTHPEFVASDGGKRLGYLCMADGYVRAWALEQVGRLIEEYQASWIKFDFNLDPGCGCSDPKHGHGEKDGLYGHYQGYYLLLDEINRKYPKVVLENCSSGGLRTDLGILKHTHVNFLSDPDYVEHHFQCFWGAASFLHPACCFHFTQSDCLEEHNGVHNPITKGMPLSKFDYILRSGMLCQIGMSYDLTKWPKALLERLKTLISFYKEISGKYILQGEMIRLCGQAIRGGLGDRWQVYQYRAADRSSIIFIFRLPGASGQTIVFPDGMNPQRAYALEDADERCSSVLDGKTLREQGIYVGGMEEESSRILFLSEL